MIVIALAVIVALGLGASPRSASPRIFVLSVAVKDGHFRDKVAKATRSI
jgi:hypothetical protein